VVVEATSTASGLREAIRALAPGAICTGVGYYLAAGTRLPLMRMYASDATLRVGVSHARAVLPELLTFLARTGFPAERVTTLAGGGDEAPTAYAARTTKVVLQRPPLFSRDGFGAESSGDITSPSQRAPSTNWPRHGKLLVGFAGTRARSSVGERSLHTRRPRCCGPTKQNQSPR
jgi:hypothetical protein